MVCRNRRRKESLGTGNGTVSRTGLRDSYPISMRRFAKIVQAAGRNLGQGCARLISKGKEKPPGNLGGVRMFVARPHSRMSPANCPTHHGTAGRRRSFFLTSSFAGLAFESHIRHTIAKTVVWKDRVKPSHIPTRRGGPGSAGTPGHDRTVVETRMSRFAFRRPNRVARRRRGRSGQRGRT